MADIPVPGYQSFWAEQRKVLKTGYKNLLEKFPDADAQLRQLFRVLCDIEDVARYTPASVGESDQWSAIVNVTEENKLHFCKALNGKPLFSALYGSYTVALQELKAVLKASNSAGQSQTPKSPATQEDGFKKVRRRKRHSTNEAARTSKKAGTTATLAAVETPPRVVATRNFFAPLRTTGMENDTSNTPQEEAPSVKKGRPPPIVLTSAVNLIQLQKQLKSVVSWNFEFRNTRNGTRVITRGMADFQAIKTYFDNQNLSYFSFFPKSEKPIKAVIRHLPHNTPAEDISDGLISLGSWF
jgi:hypothetical protein